MARWEKLEQALGEVLAFRIRRILGGHLVRIKKLGRDPRAAYLANPKLYDGLDTAIAVKMLGCSASYRKWMRWRRRRGLEL